MAAFHAQQPQLLIDALAYRYASVPVLQDVSFAVHPGELVVLIGANGAGKSTLLRCLAGWTAPTAGVVSLQQDAARPGAPPVVLVPDTPPFYDDLTVHEHLAFLAALHRLPAWHAPGDELLVRFGLARARAAYPHHLSRGMRYKLAACLALLVEPAVLLLDEPFAPLDVAAARVLWTTLRALADNGSSVVLATHQLPEQAVPDRFLVLADGTLIVDAAAAQLQQAAAAAGESLLAYLLTAPPSSGAADAP